MKISDKEQEMKPEQSKKAKELENPLVKALYAQFYRTYRMWKEELNSIPSRDWNKCIDDYLHPSRQLIHILQAIDCYTSSKDAYTYNWKQFFPLCQEPITPFEREWIEKVENLPGKNESLEMFDRWWKKFFEYLITLSDQDLIKPNKIHRHTGATLFEKLIYILRHTQHHLGEINTDLRLRNLKRANWR